MQTSIVYDSICFEKGWSWQRREASLPEKYIPVLREAAAKVGMDWDKDIRLTDNTCGPHPIKPEGLIAKVGACQASSFHHMMHHFLGVIETPVWS